MFNHTDFFVGIRFIASIGEPWDFFSSIGQNKLEGEIKAVVVSDNGQPCFLCSVSPFTISEVVISQVVGVNRYMSSQDLVATLRNGESATMNFLFVTSGNEIAREDVIDVLSHNELTNFLVGSMKLA